MLSAVFARAMMRRRVRAFGRRVARDRSGVAALEFALIAPLMILLFFGLSELSSAIIASRRASHASSSLGDLTAQCTNINDANLSNIFSGAVDIMTPLPISSAMMNQRVSSVEVVDSSGTTQVQWSKSCTGAPTSTTTCTTSTVLAPYSTNQTVTLPANLVTNQGDSVIMSETTYNFSFPVDLFNNLIKFDDISYFKPRKSALVAYAPSGTSCYS